MLLEIVIAVSRFLSWIGESVGCTENLLRGDSLEGIFHCLAPLTCNMDFFSFFFFSSFSSSSSSSSSFVLFVCIALPYSRFRRCSLNVSSINNFNRRILSLNSQLLALNNV